MADIDKILNEAPTETIEEEKTEELIESPEIELEIDEGQDNVSLDPGAMDQGDDFWWVPRGSSSILFITPTD